MNILTAFAILIVVGTVVGLLAVVIATMIRGE